MRKWLILLLVLLAFLMSGCSYWVVEDAPVQVGSTDQPVALPLLE